MEDISLNNDNYDDCRKIIHIDMDAFYAAVEQRDNPSLRGKPIAVGGDGKRGVTCTASYEARKYGVRSAMPGWKAKELCPHLIFVPLRFDAYKEVSRTIRSIFESYTHLVEPLSLDEAYLDVTNNHKDIKYATDVAKAIRNDIYVNTGLTASAGVSYCKFLAKIASDFRKPNGLTIITPRRALPFIEQLDVRKFYGVGKVTADKMNELGIYNGLDLKQRSKEELTRYFGKSGSFYYDIARGIDDRTVESNRERKSLAVERTFDDLLERPEDVLLQAEYIAQKLSSSVSKTKFYCKTLTLKIKNKDFVTKTRSISLEDDVFENFDIILQYATQLINANLEICKSLRLLGLTVSNLWTLSQAITPSQETYDLFNLPDNKF